MVADFRPGEFYKTLVNYTQFNDYNHKGSFVLEGTPAAQQVVPASFFLKTCYRSRGELHTELCWGGLGSWPD